MVHGVSIAVGPCILTTTATAYTYTAPHLHQPHHRHCNPHLNHHRHHPRKHVVLLLIGRTTVGASGTHANAVYDYMRVERKLLAFSGYIWMTCRYCLIAPDTSWCKNIVRIIVVIIGTWETRLGNVFKGGRLRSREMPRRTNTVINSVPSRTAG